jgi:exosortase/archaeosortase family protein
MSTAENPTPISATSSVRLLMRGAVLTLVAIALLWAYWPTLTSMAAKWEQDAEYSHGWLVPFFSLFLVWLRRPEKQGGTIVGRLGVGFVLVAVAAWLLGVVNEFTWLPAVTAGMGVAGGMLIVADCLPAARLNPSWTGLLLVLAGAGLRLYAARYYMEWFDQLSLIIVAFGLVLLLGGWSTLWRTWPAVGFLIFMVPLPHRLEVSMRAPLRHVGTVSSTYAMQTMGLPAFAEGNVIVISRDRLPVSEPATDEANATADRQAAGGTEEVRIGVVEACSGLRMLMIFFALSAAMALLTDRPLWQKGVILVAAVPIALASNILRILSTGVLHVYRLDHLADLAFHDLAGWLMMPIGLLMLGALLWFLDHLFVVEEDRPMNAGLATQRPAVEPKRELQESIT